MLSLIGRLGSLTRPELVLISDLGVSEDGFEFGCGANVAAAEWEDLKVSANSVFQNSTACKLWLDRLENLVYRHLLRLSHYGFPTLRQL